MGVAAALLLERRPVGGVGAGVHCVRVGGVARQWLGSLRSMEYEGLSLVFQRLYCKPLRERCLLGRVEAWCIWDWKLADGKWGCVLCSSQNSGSLSPQ